MLRYSLIFVIFLLLPTIAIAKGSPDPGGVNTQQLSQEHSLLFIENKGQITDQFYHSRADIDFKIAAGKGLTIFLGKGQLHYQWADNSKVKSQNSKVKNGFSYSDKERDDSSVVSLYRMDVRLLNANPNAEIIAEDVQDYTETYYTSSSSLTEGKRTGLVAHGYKKITYRNIYPKIDWVLYVRSAAAEKAMVDKEGEGSGLKYDFVVHPGGNVKDIRLKYGGDTSLALNEDGSISATTPFGSIKEEKPYSYEKENGNIVSSKFILRNNVLSFDIALNSYENNKTLVIDPILAWATYYGGSGNDGAGGVACDGAGNVYMTGGTSSSSNIATTGAYQTSIVNTSEAFLVKFSGSGSRLWGTYFGNVSGGSSGGNGVACDGTGNVYIVGQSSGNIGTTSGAYQTTFGGNEDAYLAKFNSSGSLQWATYFGSNGYEDGRDVACDGSGYVYITGFTSSSFNIASSSSYQSSYGGGSYDAYLAKFSSSGGLQWATYFGGSGYDEAWGLSCDASNNVCIAGYTASTSSIATSGAYQTSLSGPYDAFLAKFNSAGSLQWATYYGGSATEFGSRVTCDNNKNIYLAGNTLSTSNIASSNAFQTTPNLSNSWSDFLVKFDSSGNRHWATYYGGTASTVAGYAGIIQCDVLQNVYLSSLTTASSNVATANAYQTSYGGSGDAYLVEFDSSGNRKYGTYFGGSGADDEYGLAYDHQGSMYIAGQTFSSSNIASSGAYQTTLGGSSDAYLAKFSWDTSVSCNQPYTDTLKCAGSSFNLSYIVSSIFNSGNTFTAQLSNASGSFASPVTIGSVNATNSGTISCTIPANIPTGTGYRVRIIASNPVDTSLDDGVNIHIFRLPAPYGITNNSPLCLSDILHVALNDSASGVTYSWTGPNNFSSSAHDTTRNLYTYSDSGYYYVHLTLGACSLYDTFHVVIKTSPVKPVNSSNSPVCTGKVLQLTLNNVQTGVTYSWTGPNNFSSSTQSPSINNVPLADSGNYIITATLANGCHAADTAHVVVNLTPSFTVSNSSPVCSGDILYLSANGTTGTNYSWTGPSNFNYPSSSSVSISNVTMANAGTYYLMASLNGCIVYDTLSVTVGQAPATPTVSNNGPLCSNSSLSFSASSTTPGVTYQWYGPNNFSSVLQNPTINPVLLVDSGNYWVKAMLNGCGSASDTTHVVISQGLDSFYANCNTPLCTGDTLRLHTGSSVAGVNYSWSGPNSFSSNSANNTILNASFSNAGYYYLTASLNNCVNHDTFHVIINQSPATPLLSSNGPVCQAGNLQLTVSNPQSGVTYSWTGVNSFTSATQNPVRNNIMLADSGLYFATATLGSCKSTAGIYVMTKALPPQPSLSSNSPVCAGDTLKLSALNANPSVSYNWSGPVSFSSTIYDPYISSSTTANSGNYYVTQTLNGCSIADTISVLVKPSPAVPNIGSNSPVCAGNSLQLTVSNWLSPVAYNWVGPNNFSSGIYNPVINNMQTSNAGSYKVTANLNGCIADDSVQVTVKPYPSVPSTNSNSPVCAGDSLHFTVGNLQSGVTYSWSGPNSFVSAIYDPTIHNASTANTGNYKLVADLNGCKDTVSLSVTVNAAIAAPVISISVLPGDTVCEGSPVTFTATLSNTGNPVYTWMKNGNNMSVGNTSSFTTSSLINGDDIVCKVTSTLQCQQIDTATSNIIQLHVLYFAPPVISVSNYPLSFVNGVIVTYTGHVPPNSQNLTYAWTKNGVIVPGATTSVFTTNNVGPLDTVCFVVYSGVKCTVPDSSVACAEASTAVNSEHVTVNSLKVWPNPFDLTLSFSLQGEGTARMYDAVGRLVYSTEVLKGDTVIDTRSFVSGVYFLQVVSADGSKDVRKVVKE